jgi:hypothetical protein
MCSNTLSVGQLYQQISTFETVRENKQMIDNFEQINPLTSSDCNSQIIRQAAFILKTEIEKMILSQE